jgi:broad specificity phosphatase PhoE
MKIVLIRHFKVDFKWKLFYSSSGYEKACDDYDHARIVQGHQHILSFNRIYSSSLNRAIETTKLVFNKVPDIIADSLNEIPVRSFINTRMCLPKIIWDIAGRLEWRFGCNTQPESYSESKARIDNFIDNVLIQNKDCCIVAHGWIIKLIMESLRKNRFIGPNPVFIRSGIPYEYISN